MARFNTQQSTISVTGATTLSYVLDKATILLTGSSGYTLTLANPVTFPGTIQTIYNATGGNVTISSSGNLIGNGFTAATSQLIPNNTTYTVTSNGTDYVITNNQGGPISVTTGTFSGAVTANSTLSVSSTLTASGTFTASSTVGMSPSNASVTISPSGSGTVTISPATAGSINNMSIGATTRGAGAFTTLDANSTVGLSPSNASVTISPSGSGTVTISPATAGSINNMSIGATTRGAGAFTTLAANSSVSMTAGTASSSTSTGTLVVSGGVGISGNVYSGGTIYGNLSSSSATLTGGSVNGMAVGNTTQASGSFTTLAANSSVSMTAGTASSSTSTGTLVVSGGVGISGNVYVGNTMTAATVSETSSIAFKENIEPINNALDLVLQLVGVTYDRKDNKEHDAGLIAEAVYEIIPDLVVLDNTGKPNSIKYSKITAYLVESIKTLKKEIDSIKGLGS